MRGANRSERLKMGADQALEALHRIRSEFDAFCAVHGEVSEADTRAKVIDRVLREVCTWPESSLTREDHVVRGYTDYCLSVQGRRLVAVEAKRHGIPFIFPVGRQHRSLKLSGTLLTAPPVREAIQQVRTYCDDGAIRYAIATNGYAWIVFRAIREDMSWRDGSARVFTSIDEILADFTAFWNLLSFEAISAASLDAEFGAYHRAPRQLLRVVDRLFNSDLPLQRNRLHSQLHPLIRTIFEDIADQDQIEILQSCYVHSHSIRVVAEDLNCVITDTIPRFLRDQGTEPIQQGRQDAGRFGVALSGATMRTSGQLFLLLGGIGSGKTTFIKRYQRTVGADLLNTQCIWFHVDFLSPPERHDIGPFVWRSILDQLRVRYTTPHLETRRNIKRAFAAEIAALHETALKSLHPDSAEFDAALSPYLERWQSEVSEYVPRLLRECKPRRDLSVVVFIDNVDQLAPDYQAQIFLLAQRVARSVGAVTIVSLREESYYTASIQKTFTAYTNRKFHVASPRFRWMIGNRIRFALELLSRGDSQRDPILSSSEITLDRESISEFLSIVQESIFEVNRNIARFIECVCFGNMRQALQMFATFISSGATDVDKMLNIYRRDGAYYVGFHEFVKSVMLGERRYYKEAYSPIMNVFDCGAERNASHFTALRIVRVLLSMRGVSTREGQGYVETTKVATLFEDLFDNMEDFIRTANRLVERQLVETNTRSTDSIDGASHIRATTAGWYYPRYLVSEFCYLDLVLQDTPLDDVALEAELRKAVYAVDNLGDRDEDKVQRLQVRFLRVERFLEYLAKQEQGEIAAVGERLSGTVLSEPLLYRIGAEYARERDWIARRVRENRERIKEDFSAVGVIEGDEMAEADDSIERE